MAYSRIREAFEKMGKKLNPENEIKGLSEKDLKELNPCGTRCGECKEIFEIINGSI